MRSSVKKYLGIRFLAVVAIVCITAASAIAQDANQPATEDVNKPTIEDVNRLAAENVNTPVAEDVNTPVAEDVNKPAEGMTLEQRLKERISVDFRNTPIEDVIRIMAERADIDIVKSPNVTGEVTVTLTDVPLEEALNNILAAQGNSYVLTENMIRVVTVAEKKLETDKPEVLVTRTYEIVYADVKEVVKALEKFKSKLGMVTSIQGTSHILVKDTESTIKDITAFIEKVDRMTAQILVEARIYDITSKDSFDIGVDWYAGRNTPITDITEKDTYKRTDTTQSGDAYYESEISWDDPVEWQEHLDYLAGISPTDGTPSAVDITEHYKPDTYGYGITDTDERTKSKSKTWHLGADGSPLPFRKSKPYMGGQFNAEEGGTLRFGVLNDAVDIELALSILHKQVGAKLLANPRILVLDNEKATINITSEIPYQRLTESAMGGSMGTTEFKEVGVKLEVTPHLAARDEMIRLQLKPEFSVKTSDVIITTTGAGARYPIPVVDKRTADTILLIKNGQTVVLGGLKKKETTQDIRKVPLLGDLPLFGNLFRSESEDTVDSEIVVFITTWIIKEPLMSPDEQKAYDVTEFSGPKPSTTKAEKRQEEQQDDGSGTD